MEQAEQKINFFQKSGFSLPLLFVLLLSFFIWYLVYPHPTPKTQASGTTINKQKGSKVATVKIPAPKTKNLTADNNTPTLIPTSTQITRTPQETANNENAINLSTISPVENKPTTSIVTSPILEPTKAPDVNDELASLGSSINQILSLKVTKGDEPANNQGEAKGKAKQ